MRSNCHEAKRNKLEHKSVKEGGKGKCRGLQVWPSILRQTLQIWSSSFAWVPMCYYKAQVLAFLNTSDLFWKSWLFYASVLLWADHFISHLTLAGGKDQGTFTLNPERKKKDAKVIKRRHGSQSSFGSLWVCLFPVEKMAEPSLSHIWFLSPSDFIRTWCI